MNYTSFEKRACASFVDFFVTLFLITLVFAVCGVTSAAMEIGQLESIGLTGKMPTVVFWSLLWLTLTLRFTLAHASRSQATVGKMLMGIQVADTTGCRISFGRSFIRSLCYPLSSVLLFGFLLVLISPTRKGLHDYLAGTCVIKKPVKIENHKLTRSKTARR